MIVTVTLNPSLDRTVEVDALTRGAVLRAGSTHLDPGGKGVNVTRALLANGVASRAVLPVAGAEGAQLVELLAAEGVQAELVQAGGRTRSNIAIAECDGTVTKVNEPGTALTADELEQVVARALELAARGDWVVLCGSLPPGVPVDQYARMTQRLRAAGLRVVVDSSGAPLVHAVDAAPDLMKPNVTELAEVTGRSLLTRGDVVDAARELLARGVGRVLVSLGADGAILVDASGVVAGESPVTDARSTVGAGDACLAGFLAASLSGSAADGALGAALAWGAAAVRLPGSRMPGPAEVADSPVLLDADPLAADRLAEPLREAAHVRADAPSIAVDGVVASDGAMDTGGLDHAAGAPEPDRTAADLDRAPVPVPLPAEPSEAQVTPA